MIRMSQCHRLPALVGLVVLLAGGVGAARADGVPTLFNTGVDDAGDLLAHGVVDPHYVAVSAPGATSPTAAIAGGNQFGQIGNGGSIYATISSPGAYDYQTTFDLTGFDPATAEITGWVVDGYSGSVLLNGVAEASIVPNLWTSLDLTTGFVAGVNTLDFVFDSSSGPFDNGITTALSGTATAVPEPGSLFVLVVGLLGLTYLGRRRACDV